MPARPVDHIDMANVKTIAPDQRRQKAMQAIEIGQRQEDLAPKRLEAAAGIARAVVEQVRARRWPYATAAFEACALAADALPGDEAESRRAGLERGRSVGMKAGSFWPSPSSVATMARAPQPRRCAPPALGRRIRMASAAGTKVRH